MENAKMVTAAMAKFDVSATDKALGDKIAEAMSANGYYTRLRADQRRSARARRIRMAAQAARRAAAAEKAAKAAAEKKAAEKAAAALAKYQRRIEKGWERKAPAVVVSVLKPVFKPVYSGFNPGHATEKSARVYRAAHGIPTMPLRQEIAAYYRNLRLDHAVAGDNISFRFDLQEFAQKPIAKATKEDLVAVKGIGEKTADAILAARDAGAEYANDFAVACKTAARLDALMGAFTFADTEEVNAVADEARIAEIARKYEAHRNDAGFIKAATEGMGTASLQKIYFRVTETGNLKAKMGVTKVNVTPINKAYIHSDVKLWNSIGHMKRFDRASEEIVVFDFKGVVSSPNADAKETLISYLKDNLYLVNDNGKAHLLVEIGDEFDPDMPSMFRDLLSGMNFADSMVHEQDGSLKKGVRVFFSDAGDALNSSAQGRTWQIAANEVTTPEMVAAFADVMDEATVGEYSLNMKLGDITKKELADVNTRMSSKATKLGMGVDKGCAVENYAILFSKDDNTDGMFIMSQDMVAKQAEKYLGISYERAAKAVLGQMVQARPYTVKGAAVVVTKSYVDTKLEKLNLLIINVNDKANEKVLDNLNVVLSKVRRSRVKGAAKKLFAGYDGVVICRDESAPVGFYADLNAFKDQYDQKRTDGINVLAMPKARRGADAWKAYTSAQFLKSVLYAMRIDNGVLKEGVRVIKGVINREIEQDCDLSIKPEEFGHEMIDASYVNGVARNLFSDKLGMVPGLYGSMIKDCASRIANSLTLDRFMVNGHSAMMTADFAYELTGAHVLQFTKDYVEVYDPLHDRYAETMGVKDNRGVAIKHPSMGLREILFIRYISEDEMIERIRKAEAKEQMTQEEANILCYIVRNFKEGGVMIPANLGLIASIAAGSDLDGDELVMHFIDPNGLDFVHVLWDSKANDKFDWVAVEIGKPDGDERKNQKVTSASFIDYLILQMGSSNESVGAVTVTFRLLHEGLLMNEGKAEVRNFYTNLFKSVFGMGRGKKAYVSPIQRKQLSVLTYVTKADVLDEVETAIKAMAPTWENIKAALEDLNIVARHIQELTIDAQKKFYVVTCGIVKAVRKFSIAPFKFGIDFEFASKFDKEFDGWLASAGFVANDMYSYNKNTNAVYSNGLVNAGDEKHPVSVIEDAFSGFRMMGANAALKKLQAMASEFMEKVNSDEIAALREKEFANANLVMQNPELKVRLGFIAKLAYTAKNRYTNFIDEARVNYLTPDMTEADIREAEEDIRKEAYEDCEEFYDSISNEVRKLIYEFKVEGATVSKVIAYLSKKQDIFGNVFGKLLKEETVYYAIKLAGQVKGERLYAEKQLDATAAFFVSELDQKEVEVRNGEIVETGDVVDLADGKWNVVSDEKSVKLVRGLNTLVELPLAKRSKLAFQLSVEGSWHFDTTCGAWNGAVPAGTEVSLKLVRRGKASLVDVYVDGQPLMSEDTGKPVSVYTGGSQQYRIMQNYYDGFSGKVNKVTPVYHEEIDKSGNKVVKEYTFVELIDVHKA